jgi:hypothetical protein
MSPEISTAAFVATVFAKKFDTCTSVFAWSAIAFAITGFA